MDSVAAVDGVVAGQPEATPARLAAADLWLMGAFGFVSGLPLALSGFTLKQWLAVSGVSTEVIGLATFISLPYTLKLLWSPALDSVRLLPRFGRRRGWLLAIQPLLALACLGLALCDAGSAPRLAIAAAGCVAFLSATQDVAIDAWRIETFPQRLQGAATAAYVWGYRIAMLVSGAGVIAASTVIGWHAALFGVAILAALGIVVTLFAREKPAVAAPAWPAHWLHRTLGAWRDPLGDFASRPGAAATLLYVALFYLGEAIAGAMLAPFYRDLGFNSGAVATAIGPFSLVATLAGIGAGGWLVARLGLSRALIATGFTQMAAMAMYVLLSVSPGNHGVLYGTVVVEAFVQGLATAAFLAFLSGQCAAGFAATQYALLNSVASLAAHTVGGFSGFLAGGMGWPAFYTLAMLASLPAMLVMLYMLRRYPPEGV
jgi:PAT family beta-lactamase induction signal transducer AmpG